MDSEEDVTLLLESLSGGDQAALDRLFAALYGRLHSMAHAQRRGWSGQDTLNTTALVHEAYLKLSGCKRLQPSERGHFYAIAARAMRQLLINHAQRRCAAKRGGGLAALPLDEELCAVTGAEEELLALDSAMDRLEQLGARQCRVVECRFFAGLNVTETSEALAVSPATVKRDWAFASAWLSRELAETHA